MDRPARTLSGSLMPRVLSHAYVWVPIMAPDTFFCPQPPTLAVVTQDLVHKRWVTKRRAFHDDRSLCLRLSRREMWSHGGSRTTFDT
jgi:hypothetical protein